MSEAMKFFVKIISVLLVSFVLGFAVTSIVLGKEDEQIKVQEMILSASNITVFIAVGPDGANWTVIVIRGRDASALAEMVGGATVLEYKEHKVIVVLDLSKEI